MALFASGCSPREQRADAAKPTEITLFFTSELRGTLEPCGCTSDPLGDLARTAAALAAARAQRPTALLDGGSTLYLDSPVPPQKEAQAELIADALAEMLPKLGLAAAGLGPFDLPRARFARQAANVTAGAPTEPPKIVVLGAVKVGVFGVVAPGALPGVTAGDPLPAARAAIASLRGQGAQVVVALAGMTRADARKLARDAPGADLIVVGKDVPDQGAPLWEAVGQSFLVAPVDRGQVLGRVDLHVEGAGPFVDAVGPERAGGEIARLDKRIAALAEDVARWEKDATAEKAFVDKNRAELAGLKKERDELRARPLRVPASGSWLTFRAVPIKRRLPCDKAVVARKNALEEAIGAANRKAAAGEKPPQVAAGKAAYTGIEECGYCHKAAVAFWKKSRHAGAWKTLTAVGKQWNRDCIGCHLTGWAEPGGATLVDNEPLRDVQCESCHGPASIHVDKDGKDEPRTIARGPAPDLCAARCHTPEHSDTFQLEAYLRDVTGPGHAEALRKKLGAGPTGHELRSAALAKAGRDLGANCPK